MGIVSSRRFQFSFGLLVALAAVSMMVVPAFAAKQPKLDVCHYQAEDEYDAGLDGVLGTLDDVLVSPLGWRVINISGNALTAHVDEHSDGITADFVIGDADVDGNGIADDLEACQALSPFIEGGDEEDEPVDPIVV